MVTRRTAILVCLLALTLPVGAAEVEIDDEHLSLELDTVLERFRLAQEGTSTLVADFMQIKASSLLVGEQVAKGRLYYSRPDKFLWAYTEPDETLMLINGDVMLTWYPDLNRAQKVDIARKRKRIFHYFAIGEEVNTLKENFVITLKSPCKEDPPGSIHLEMVPKRRRVRDRLSSVEMWLDGEHYLPAKLRFEEADGDFTLFQLDNLEPNADIPEDRFTLELPEDATVDATFSRPEPRDR